MSLLVGLVLLVVVPMAAASGKAYRGAYLALCLLTGVAGFFALMMGFSNTPPGGSAEAQRGIAFIHTYFPTLGWWLLATSFGSLLGAALYRPARATRRAEAPK